MGVLNVVLDSIMVMWLRLVPCHYIDFIGSIVCKWNSAEFIFVELFLGWRGYLAALSFHNYELACLHHNFCIILLSDKITYYIHIETYSL